jgi:hypothetical protein
VLRGVDWGDRELRQLCGESVVEQLRLEDAAERALAHGMIVAAFRLGAKSVYLIEVRPA